MSSFLERLLGKRDAHGQRRRGSWVQTYSGVQFWAVDPRADEVCFDDVVIGMARECRYGNQCREHYSVLTHSVLVSIYVEKLARERGYSIEFATLAAREGLVHDAGEAYGRDMPAPIKHHRSMRGYRKMLDRIQDKVFEHFEVYPSPPTSALVHEVDIRIRVDEVKALMLDPQMYENRHAPVKGLDVSIPYYGIRQSIDVFCQRFAELFPEYVGVDGNNIDANTFNYATQI